MRSIYVPVPESAIEPLVELARRELRDPKAQAGHLILEGLRRAGFDVDIASSERAALQQRSAANR